MKVSLCLTTFNEAVSIGRLLESLLGQTKRADEIVIVDGGSKDKTVEIIRHFQKKDNRIRLLIQKCSRAEGRNIGVEIAKNEIIAITDAGCVAHKDWLDKITQPFVHRQIDIVAGFYKMVGEKPYQKAISVFLGKTPSQFGVNFLPSTRSIAFRKEAWEKIGGFPEKDINTAEDTDFNYKAIKMGMKYSRVKSAIVEWGMPSSIKAGLKKLHDYAEWDARYGIWWHPAQRLASHNIRVLSIFGRYLTGLLVLYLTITTRLSPIWLILGIFAYSFWAFRKVYVEYGNWQVGIWGIILQYASDFAVMTGFIGGIAGRDGTHAR